MSWEKKKEIKTKKRKWCKQEQANMGPQQIKQKILNEQNTKESK